MEVKAKGLRRGVAKMEVDWEVGRSLVWGVSYPSECFPWGCSWW